MSTTRVLRRSGQFSLKVRPSTNARLAFGHPAPLHHQLDDLADHVGAHAVIEATPCKDDLRVVADGLGLVGQVVGIDTDTMPADQAGAKRQEVPLAPGGLKDLLGIDPEAIEDQRQLIDQRDVHVALGVLDHLGRLRDADTARLVGPGNDDAAVKGIDEIRQPRGWSPMSPS